jgi:hypothetical protein
VVDGGALRDLARYHRPTVLIRTGVGAETIAESSRAGGELIGRRLASGRRMPGAQRRDQVNPPVPHPGAQRGATIDEVKRAYRRLAKINHPDAAGEAALPRFLAIQAAYERLAGPGTPGVARRAPAPRRPWDPAADATRRAYGGRAQNAPPTGGGAGGTSGTTDKDGEAGASGRRHPGRWHQWRRVDAATGPAGSTSGRPDAGAPNSPPRLDAGHRHRREARTERATFGSTLLRRADAEPFEPDWGGANRYGTTSGTY